jgi:hypothetical protein
VTHRIAIEGERKRGTENLAAGNYNAKANVRAAKEHIHEMTQFGSFLINGLAEAVLEYTRDAERYIQGTSMP